jgi:hypothetical protein
MSGDWKDLSNRDFVEAFVLKHRPLIKTLGRRYLIPNRYSVQDIEEYIAERMLSILAARQHSTNQILDREKYFLNCLVFYCIEYQRLNGFIFCLPKRPRKNAIDDELEAKGRNFHYLNDTMLDDPSLVQSDEAPPDPGMDSEVWTSLTGYLHDTDARVVECIHKMNMTLKETSLHLGVAQSTCLTRRDRAYKTLFSVFDSASGMIHDTVQTFLRVGSGVFQT